MEISPNEIGMKSGKGLADGSRRYWFKPGNPGGGRPKGTKSLKEFAREYLMALDDEGKREFLGYLPPDLVWRMSEGNPHSTTDETVTHVIPQPIMKLSSVDVTKDALPSGETPAIEGAVS